MRRLICSVAFSALALTACADPSPAMPHTDAGVLAPQIAPDGGPLFFGNLEVDRAFPLDAGGPLPPIDPVEPVPATTLFVDGSPFEIGASFDRATDTVGPVCDHGPVTFERGSSATLSTRDNEYFFASDLFGYGGTRLSLDAPEGSEQFYEATRPNRAITAATQFSIDWGIAHMEWESGSDEAECGREFLHQLRFGARYLNVIKLEFQSDEAATAFALAHGNNLRAMLAASDEEREALQRELAEIATMRVLVLQVGGDRARTEALLADHACSVTNFAACNTLFQALQVIEPLPDPEAGDYHGWAIVNAFAFESPARTR